MNVADSQAFIASSLFQTIVGMSNQALSGDDTSGPMNLSGTLMAIMEPFFCSNICWVPWQGCTGPFSREKNHCELTPEVWGSKNDSFFPHMLLLFYWFSRSRLRLQFHSLQGNDTVIPEYTVRTCAVQAEYRWDTNYWTTNHYWANIYLVFILLLV